MITPTTDGAAAPAPCDGPSVATASIQVRLLAVWVVTAATIILLVVMTFLLNMGFHFDREVLTQDHAMSLLDQYNTIVGSLASAVSTPIELIVSSILTLLVLRHTITAASGPASATPTASMVERVKLSLFRIVFSKLVLLSLITAGFTSAYVDMQNTEIVTRRMNLLDLGYACESCGSSSSSSSTDEPFVLQTVLRTAFVDKVEATAATIVDRYIDPSILNPSILRSSPQLTARFNPSASWMLRVGPHTPIATTLDDQVVLELTFQGLLGLFNTLQRGVVVKLEGGLVPGHDSIRIGYTAMYQDWLAQRASGSMRDFVRSQLSDLRNLRLYGPLIDLSAVLDLDTLELVTERYQLAEHVVMDMVVVRVEQRIDLTDLKPDCCGGTTTLDNAYESGECGRQSCVFPSLRDQELGQNVTFPTQQVAVNFDLFPCLEQFRCPGGTCPAPASTEAYQFDSDFVTCLDKQVTETASNFIAYGYSALMDVDDVKNWKFENPRKVHEFALARVQWEHQDLSTRFGAECIADKNDCFGIVRNTASSTVVLKGTGKPGARRFPGLSSERALVTLDMPERHVHFLRTPQFQDNMLANELVDAYDKGVRTNHLYIEDLRVPMYLSSLFFIFGDGAERRIDPAATNGALMLDGDDHLRVSRFRVQVPLIASIQTLVGCCLLVVSIVIITLGYKFDKRIETPQDLHLFITHVWHTTLPAMFLDRVVANRKGRMVIEKDMQVQAVVLLSGAEKADAMEIRTTLKRTSS